MTGEPLIALRALWLRRASDREETAVRLGLATMEGRVMSASAAETRQCLAELLEVLADDECFTVYEKRV